MVNIVFFETLATEKSATGIQLYLIPCDVPVVVGLVVGGRRLLLVVERLAELLLVRIHLLVGRLKVKVARLTEIVSNFSQIYKVVWSIRLYRVGLVVWQLGWVDLDLECSTILLGQ